jgi:metallo-beta-lactamase family protein
MALNRRKGAFVVISAGGMCEGGRVVHHLKHGVSKAENTIALIGFQGQYTLGRAIADRRPFVRIFDRQYPLKAHVETLSGLSAHADAEDFQWWFRAMHSDSSIGRAFVVHGEKDSAEAQVRALDEFCDEPALVPEPGKTYEV